jgi:transposase-like protein
MMDFEEALRIARAVPTPIEAAHAVEALPERVRALESENVILRAALAHLRAGGKERKPPLRDRAAYARLRRARKKANANIQSGLSATPRPRG